MPVRIREATAADRDACYEICLRTADAGQDARSLYRDPELVGSVYAGPYLAVVGGFGYVAVDEDGVAGYVLGAGDTRAFEAACEATWWPTLRSRHPDPGPAPATPDDRIRRLIHAPPVTAEDVVRTYPAHLHIDLLPRLQGSGAGRVLMEAFQARLRAEGVTGMHLGVSRANDHAIGFYRHVGFTTLSEDQDGLVMGLPL